MQVSVHWKKFSDEYIVFNKPDEQVESTFTFVGAALLIACEFVNCQPPYMYMYL